MARLKSIKYKMLLGFSIVLILVLAQGTYANITAQKVKKETEYIVDEQVTVLTANQQLAYTVSNRIALVRSYIATRDTSFKEMFWEYSEIGEHYAQIMEDALVSEEYDSSGINALRDWEMRVEEEIFDRFENGQIGAAQKNISELMPVGQDIMLNFEQWALTGEEQIKEAGSGMVKDSMVTALIVGISSSIVIILGIVIAIITARMITNPLRVVMHRMNSIAAGDFSEEPLQIKSKDEIGQLVEATNRMSENSKLLLQDIDRVSGRINEQSDGLRVYSTEVQTGSDQIAVTMEELARGSESQAEHASSLSAMMDSFNQKVVETNDNSGRVHAVSENVLEMTNDGTSIMETSTNQMQVIDGIVHDAVKKVEGLDTHTREISALVLVIQDIADQTNLLALNAAIEAARAGEHGAGFSVVADEVRTLAEQVSHSVTDITGIVESIQNESSAVTESLQEGYKEVELGTKHIQTTHETFKQISEAVTDMARNIHISSENLIDITKNSEEMSRSIQEIAAISEESAAGVEQTSAQTQEASSSMEEVAISSNDLAKLAEELDRLVNQFNL
ncbi:MAG TPA: methyl-accepting chemotaxis protein [Bacillota bacterium]|nr:methyl-accepting chemotaxis protein [Bacillota bacterium]